MHSQKESHFLKSEWNDAISTRRSRRRFDSRPIDPKLLEHINDVCTGFRPFEHVRSVLVKEAPDKVFKGAIGPYGKIKGAPSFIAFIGDMRSPNVQEEIGYIGEGIILEATTKQLSTCWVGGFFSPEVVSSIIDIGKEERILAVTPIGYATKRQSLEERIMTGFGFTHRRKSLSKLVTGIEQSQWPAWIREALEAARLAPSAVNRQAWRFHVEPNSITVSVSQKVREYNISKRLCCGIAMLHIEVAALANGYQGEWELLTDPLVARFSVNQNTK